MRASLANVAGRWLRNRTLRRRWQTGRDRARARCYTPERESSRISVLALFQRRWRRRRRRRRRRRVCQKCNFINYSLACVAAQRRRRRRHRRRRWLLSKRDRARAHTKPNMGTSAKCRRSIARARVHHHHSGESKM